VKTKQKKRKIQVVQGRVEKFLEPLKEAGLQPINLQLRQTNKENINISLDDDDNDMGNDSYSQNEQDIAKMACLQIKYRRAIMKCICLTKVYQSQQKLVCLMNACPSWAY